MTPKIHPQISRVRRQSAAEQTSDLLRAYLEQSPNLFLPADEDSLDEEGGTPGLLAGFIVPRTRPV